MVKLNDALSIFYGSTSVTKVILGTAEIWTAASAVLLEVLNASFNPEAGQDPASVDLSVQYSGANALRLYGCTADAGATVTAAQLIAGSGGTGTLDFFNFAVTSPSDNDTISGLTSAVTSGEIHLVLIEEGVAEPVQSDLYVITGVDVVIASGFTSINDSFFSNSEYGFFIDGTAPTEFYANEDLTGANPPTAPADIESIRDASPNSIIIQNNNGAGGGYGTGPQWDVAETALLFGSDNLQAEMTGASLTNDMTLMFACKKDGNNDNITNILFGRGGTTSDWFLNFRTVGGSFGAGSIGTPTLYVDGVLTSTNTTAWLTNIMDDNAWHLFEIRGLDMATADWSVLNIGSREQNAVTGLLIRSMVLTSNNNPTDIENARQFWVDNHGVTLA